MHAELARKYIGLEKRFSHGRALEDNEYEEAVCDRLEIEAGEPTILRLLDVMCHFELKLAEGSKDDIPKIFLIRRKMANWMSQQDYTQKFVEKYYKAQREQAQREQAQREQAQFG